VPHEQFIGKEKKAHQKNQPSLKEVTQDRNSHWRIIALRGEKKDRTVKISRGLTKRKNGALPQRQNRRKEEKRRLKERNCVLGGLKRGGSRKKRRGCRLEKEN